MSDLFEFEKNLIEIEEEFKSRLGEDYIFHRSFVQIRDMVETMILERDEKIKDLESKLKSPNATPPPSVEKPKTIDEYYDLLEKKRKLLFSYWQNNKTSQSEKCFDEFEKFYKKMKNDYGQDVNIIALKKNKRLSDEVKMEICHEVNQKYSYMIKKYNISQKDVKPEKVCPPGKIVNPKTGRCINKPKEKTHKKPGRPRKNVDKPGPQEPEEPKEKPKKECPPGKIVNPKTGRCINKPKEKTQKRRGRPKKSEPKEDYSWIGEDSDEEEDNINPEVLKKLKLFKKETPKKYKELKKDIKKKFGFILSFDEMDKLYIYKNGEEEDLSKEAEKFILDSIKKPEPKPVPEPEKSMNFDEALEYIRTNVKPGSLIYRSFLNGIKNKFGITLKYDNHGDDYAEPTLYFMKGKKEASIEEMKKVKQYVIDMAEKSKSPSSQRKVETIKLENGKMINLDLGV